MECLQTFGDGNKPAAGYIVPSFMNGMAATTICFSSSKSALNLLIRGMSAAMRGGTVDAAAAGVRNKNSSAQRNEKHCVGRLPPPLAWEIKAAWGIPSIVIV